MTHTVARLVSSVVINTKGRRLNQTSINPATGIMPPQITASLLQAIAMIVRVMMVVIIPPRITVPPPVVGVTVKVTMIASSPLTQNLVP